jgi:electron transfer flavoprotein alpha subunit
VATLERVVICGEMTEGKVAMVTRELLKVGRKLADELNQPLSALLIGENIEAPAREVVTLGADNVYLIAGPPFGGSHPDQYIALITAACRQLSPSVLLFSHTDLGRDVAPRVAVRLKGAVTTDCTRLSVEQGTKRLIQEKPVYGGNAIAVWASEPGILQIVTVRPRASMPAEPDTSRKGEVVPLAISPDSCLSKSRLLETVREEVKGIKLEDAKVVVAGGGGIGSSEGFNLLEELAGVLGATTGVSRVPCDEGWMPLSLEIGQTGHYVSPDLYVAIGISGAPQHMVGCAGSKLLVAINRDPDANIFKEADLGVVGEYRQVLPSLIERLKALHG